MRLVLLVHSCHGFTGVTAIIEVMDDAGVTGEASVMGIAGATDAICVAGTCSAPGA